MKAVLAVLALAVLASALRESDYQNQFISYTKEFNKNYDAREFFAKYNTFKYWVDFVESHNAKNLSWTAGINQFSDMKPEEFEAMVAGCLVAPENQFSQEVPMTRAPDQIDWRTKGAVVTRVKNQGSCGSCWAFSSTGSLEGAWQIKNNELLDLSEQQLVDCSGSFGNQGCNGGLMTNSFKYLAAQRPNGITDQATYPYTGRQATCKTSTIKTVATVDSHVALKANENDLGDALKLGPVSLALAAAGTFQSYKSGILESGCGTQLNHGVLLVGYTPDASNGYWIVKNSWGQTWGNQGYIWIRAFKNVCAVGNTLNAYPIAGKKA